MEVPSSKALASPLLAWTATVITRSMVANEPTPLRTLDAMHHCKCALTGDELKRPRATDQRERQRGTRLSENGDNFKRGFI